MYQEEIQKRKKLLLTIVGIGLVFIGIIIGLSVYLSAKDSIDDENGGAPVSVFDGNQPATKNITITQFYEGTLSNKYSGEELDIVYSVLRSFLTNAFPTDSDEYTINNSSIAITKSNSTTINFSSSTGRTFKLELSYDEENTNSIIIKLYHKETLIFEYNTKNYINVLRY